MKFPLFSIVALLGFAIAEDNNEIWPQEQFEKFFTSAKEEAAPVPEMIARAKYNAEVHHVTTDDGYILEMHRISGSPTCPPANGKPVVFLMHGLICSSADWVMMGPDKGLGYILADAGYDVWMGNARGNIYSTNHTSSLSDKDYWAFSWHEIGYYDLPAMIDFALETTGQEKLIYMGHSQGSASFMVMTSQRTEYNDKIVVMFALAPAVYMGNVFSPELRVISTGIVMTLSHLFGVYDFPPTSQSFREVAATFCGANFFTKFICSNVIFFTSGYNKAELNTTMLPVIFGHFPARSSFGQFFHYGQIIRSFKFRQYDHGKLGNLANYHSFSPPDYDLSAVTAPVHVIYGANDWLVAVEDAKQLYNELGNPVELYRVPDDRWTHFDTTWGIHAKQLVYDPILATLKNTYNFVTSC